MFVVVSIITLGYLKHKHDFHYLRSAATTVLYMFKKFQAVLLFQVQNFMWCKVLPTVTINISVNLMVGIPLCYVTNSKKYVDFLSNTTTHLPYYSCVFQSTFTPPSCWCLQSQLYYQDMPTENNPNSVYLIDICGFLVKCIYYNIKLHWTWQLLYLRIWSVCVSRAFITLNKSDGSMPASDDCHACVKLSTSSIRTHTSAWESSI
jgi:hypothetical protein